MVARSEALRAEWPWNERAPLPWLEMAMEWKRARAAGHRRAKHKGRLHGFRRVCPGGDQAGFQKQLEEVKAMLSEKQSFSASLAL